MKEKFTKLIAYPHPPTRSFFREHGEDCQIVVEFSETGFRVIKDNRPAGYRLSGYLHTYDGSASDITDAVRDQIIIYFFNHPDNLPGIGATPQRQYWTGLSRSEIENIGNDGRSAFYA